MLRRRSISLVAVFCISLVGSEFRASAEDFLDFLQPDISGGKSQEAVKLMLQEPNEGQKEYLKAISPSDGAYNLTTGADGNLVGENVLDAIEGKSDDAVASFSVRLDPNLSGEDSNLAISRNGLLVTAVAEDDGVVSVSTVVGVSSPGSAEYKAAVKQVLESLKSDPSFLSVAPEISMSGSSIFDGELSLGPMPFGDDIQVSVEHKDVGIDTIDWGLNSIGAPELWDDIAAQQGKAVGVLDVGFGLHRDLPLWDTPPNIPRADHGNHVAGIICAKHDGKGTNGVVPTCLIVPRTPNFSEFDDAFGAKPTSMAAVLNAFRAVVEKRDDIKAVNISLGYNWRKRHGVMQLDDDQKQAIADLAVQMVNIYRQAKERDIFIVSAAGNDSWGLDPKLSAVWSSPMNYASLAFCKRLGLCNGVVVEAHDQNDKHADFSNIDGDLSCPGVGILSTIAFDGMHQASGSDYGVMSGTSMASPYCAGGLVLLSLLRPNYSAAEIVQCAKTSGRNTGSFAAPALDLPRTLNTCPPKG